MPEDWIMLAVLGIQLASACVAQLRLDYVYIMEDVSNGLIPVPPTFMEDMPLALHGMFMHGVLSITGIHAVKLSFLIFFYRLGHRITQYLILWGIVAFVAFASYGISMGLLEYKCVLSSLDVVFFQCTTKVEIDRQWRYMITYCTVDAVSDIFSNTSPHPPTHSPTNPTDNIEPQYSVSQSPSCGKSASACARSSSSPPSSP